MSPQLTAVVFEGLGGMDVTYQYIQPNVKKAVMGAIGDSFWRMNSSDIATLVSS